jgi:hypothetical protein
MTEADRLLIVEAHQLVREAREIVREAMSILELMREARAMQGLRDGPKLRAVPSLPLIA